MSPYIKVGVASPYIDTSEVAFDRSRPASLVSTGKGGAPSANRRDRVGDHKHAGKVGAREGVLPDLHEAQREVAFGKSASLV